MPTRQTLHLVKSVVTSCVGLALLSLIDLSVLGVVCFTCSWKRGVLVSLQAPQISLWELTRSCGLDLDCLRTAILSLAHSAQFLVAKVLTTLIRRIALPDDAAGYSSTLVDWGRICIMELSCKRFCAWIWFLAKFDKFWTSLKCYCILALNFCWVFPTCAFPVLLHLIL